MKPTDVQFANKKIENAFDKLTDNNLKRFLERAFKDIENNPFCGVQIPKRLIPKEYIIKHNIRNVWKYDLPGAWRLIYSIDGGKAIIITIILEWMDHKEYERRFKY
jgi:mRNA-degrading endonuclease RelE of RelBE toxin-antitoxin system